MEAGGFETRAIHAGQEPDPVTGAVCVPIQTSSTFAQRGVEDHTGYQYARTANPTRAALETCLASLEEARHGFAFASGMAAADAVLRRLPPGRHVLVSVDGYGGTHRLLTQVLSGQGVAFDAVDLTDLAAVERAWRPETALVWVESPTNPSLAIVDIGAVAELAHARGGLCVVDNTFATPYLQRPLTLGADVVVHSTTKYLGGHSDVIGGFVGVGDDGLADSIRRVQVAAGAVPGPFDCFLVLRGVKTLPVRMDRHCASAAAVAEWLTGHPAVERVLYPGLPDHPGHGLAARQMSGFGGMVSFAVRGGADSARAVASSTRVFTLGESLGGVESLLGYPDRMSHASLARTPLAADPAMLRLSVGLETLGDLIEDLKQALEPEV